MYFKQILHEEADCSSYVASRQTGEPAIVDPALEIEQYLALADVRDFTIK